MNHSETKKLVVTTGVPSANVFAERVSLVNEAGQSVSTKTEAELNSQFVAWAPAPTGVAATDKAALQALLDAARTAGGGDIYLKAGEYGVSIGAHPVTAGYFCGLTIGKKTRLLATLFTSIKVAASQTAGNDVTGANAVIMNYTLTGGDTDIAFHGLTIDGNAANQTHTHGGINLLRVQRAKHYDVTVTNCRGTATSGTNETFMFDSTLGTDATYTGCRAVGTAGSTASGFSANSMTGVKYTDCVATGMSVANGFTHNTSRIISYVDCWSYGNTLYGFNSEVSDGVTYTGCTAGGRTTSAAAYPSGSSTTLGNSGTGFNIVSSTEVDLIACNARHNGGSGVSWNTSASGRVIGGNYVANVFGISMDATSEPLVRLIQPNVVSNSTAQISLVGGYTTLAAAGWETTPNIIRWSPGTYYGTVPGTITTRTATDQREWMTALDVPLGGAISEIGAEIVTTAGNAGSTIRFGIRLDNNGIPGDLLVDLGTVAADTTGVKTLAVSLSTANANRLARGGRFWVTVTAQGATTTAPTMRANSNPTFGVGGIDAASALGGAGGACGWVSSGTIGTGGLSASVPSLSSPGSSVRAYVKAA